MPVDVAITKLRCLRCEHEWYPRKAELPKTCPKCRSPYWNTPRLNQAGQPAARRRGDNNG